MTFRYGVDNQNTLGVRQLVDGKFVAREFLGFAIFLFAAGTLCALFLVWRRTGLPFLSVTFAGIAAALVYPPLKYRVGGDAVIFIAYTPHTAFCYGVDCDGDVVAWMPSGRCYPPEFSRLGILHANNLRGSDGYGGRYSYACLSFGTKTVSVAISV